MVKQLQTWYVITNKEKLDVKALFHKPWSDTPNSQIKTYTRQLERRQVNGQDSNVIISESDKVNHFVSQMYLSEIFEYIFLDDWEDGSNKGWASTKKLFADQ